MILIAHRGNVNGKIALLENSPSYVHNALDIGLHVEVDVWKMKDSYYLGHDEPCYPVDKSLLLIDEVWCHAKNFQALLGLKSIGAHCFWLEEDRFTLTSQGFIWCYSDALFAPNVIVVNLSARTRFLDCFGVCSDYPLSYINT